MKETLEEALERLYPENIVKLGNNTSYDAALIKRKDFTYGAKWQQEQDKKLYSEEEVYDILIHHTIELFKKEPISLEDFWNKFKKK